MAIALKLVSVGGNSLQVISIMPKMISLNFELLHPSHFSVIAFPIFPSFKLCLYFIRKDIVITLYLGTVGGKLLVQVISIMSKMI